MLRPFRLRRPIGLDYNMDLDDAFNTKKALRDLGHFRTPKYGLTPYPDQPMIDGVKSFQRRNGLREDGVMKPDGPTITALGQALDQRKPKRPGLGIVEGEWDWRRREARKKNPLPESVFTTIPRRRPKPPSVFDVLGNVGRGSPNRPQDVLALRRALAWAGHLPRHKAANATDANEELFAAVKGFQKVAKLKTDGLVGRSGETARALDSAIATKVKTFLQETADKDAAGATSDKRGPQIAKALKPRRDGGSDILEGSGIMSPFIGGGGAAAIGTGIAAQEIIRQQLKRQGIQTDEVPSSPDPSAVRPRTDIAPSLPPTPGFEPPKEKDRPPAKTESPAQPVELPDLSQPLPNVDKPTIFVHPVPPEELQGGMIIERKGNEATRKELEGIRDFYEGQGWKHVAGGRYSERHEKVLEGFKKAGEELGSELINL